MSTSRCTSTLNIIINSSKLGLMLVDSTQNIIAHIYTHAHTHTHKFIPLSTIDFQDFHKLENSFTSLVVSFVEPNTSSVQGLSSLSPVILPRYILSLSPNKGSNTAVPIYTRTNSYTQYIQLHRAIHVLAIHAQWLYNETNHRFLSRIQMN